MRGGHKGGGGYGELKGGVTKGAEAGRVKDGVGVGGGGNHKRGRGRES